MTLAGVVVFGPWLGFALSLFGAAAGSVVAFVLGRRFGRPMVARMIGEGVLDRYSGKMGADGWWLVVTMQLPIPAGGDAVRALAGLSEMSPWRFTLVSTVARVPWTAFNVLVAAGLASGSSGLIAGCGVATVLVAVGAFLYARRGEHSKEKEEKA